MGIIYPSSMLSKPRGLVASGFDPISAYGSDLALWLDPSYGVYTDRSTQLTAASSQYWTVASNATLQMGDIDFWTAGWVYLDATSGGKGLWGKYANEYVVYESGGALVFYVGATSSGIAATIATGGWHFILAWHDAVNNTVNMRVDGGATASGALSGGQATGATAFSIGGPFGGFSDMRADSVMLGKNPVGGVAGVIAAIHTSLFNSGAGKVAADITAAEATAWGLVSAWDFDGDGLDAHGSNDLTAVNSPTYTSGIASGVAGDGDVVSLVDARTGPNCGPPSYAGRPLWVANAGKPYFSFDGTNDGLQTASNISLGAFTIAGNFYASGTAGMLYEFGPSGANRQYLYGTTVSTANVSRATGTTAKDLSSNWAVDSTWRTISHQYGGTHASHVLRFNGAAQTLSDVAPDDPGSTPVDLLLNIACRSQSSLFSTMRLGDLVAVNRVLTAGELAQLESWLASRRAA